MLLGSLLMACLAFYAWQWRQLQQPIVDSAPPEEGTPEYYRQAYNKVLETMGNGDLEQAREQLDELREARGEATGRLPGEKVVAPTSDLHSNPLHVGGTAGVDVQIHSPIPRVVNAALGRCQLRIEWLANERNGQWQVETSVIEPEQFLPLSEREQVQIQQQALAEVRQDGPRGATQWSQFVFTRADCLRQ